MILTTFFSFFGGFSVFEQSRSFCKLILGKQVLFSLAFDLGHIVNWLVFKPFQLYAKIGFQITRARLKCFWIRKPAWVDLSLDRFERARNIFPNPIFCIIEDKPRLASTLLLRTENELILNFLGTKFETNHL